MKQTFFNELCAAMGVSSELAELSFQIPTVHEGVLHFRAFCLADMLIKKVASDHQISWAEVMNVFTYSEDRIYAFIQFNSYINAFPLEIPIIALNGSKAQVEVTIAKVLKNLPEQIRVWLKVTKQGYKKMTIKEFSMKLNRRPNYLRS
ncbi:MULTISPECIES: hypothetical protein [unclassified Paenibacillus]|uniref:Uncharacterized protein n=1 Tax=Paenibacillus provencensis TaxID=441151 RepID=A0ABW3Q9W9_9BACL|nr:MULTISPECIES: hypothetical protein [unclassified Paenibacillus]MCM3130604.1 hypothetical protein [Paenibacillus sp. MER 78]SDX74731.1 hypothetical protein SAMN05518848_11370 [Paenibacillus sp. PDC88]SFS89960.1 hypothetical protein SAMN04488601_106190 [Paenibacillus sp. 453mf]